MNTISATDSPASLVAIIVAARRAGDRDLERAARRELTARYGVKLIFAREMWPRRRLKDEPNQ